MLSFALGFTATDATSRHGQSDAPRVPRLPIPRVASPNQKVPWHTQSRGLAPVAFALVHHKMKQSTFFQRVIDALLANKALASTFLQKMHAANRSIPHRKSGDSQSREHDSPENAVCADVAFSSSLCLINCPHVSANIDDWLSSCSVGKLTPGLCS